MQVPVKRANVLSPIIVTLIIKCPRDLYSIHEFVLHQHLAIFSQKNAFQDLKKKTNLVMEINIHK